MSNTIQPPRHFSVNALDLSNDYATLVCFSATMAASNVTINLNVAEARHIAKLMAEAADKADAENAGKTNPIHFC